MCLSATTAPRRASRPLLTVQQVVRAEAPISFPLAARRVADLWRIGRVTNRALDRFGAILATSGFHSVMWRDVAYLWCTAHEPASYRGFRVAGNDADTARSPEDLPPEEIINAAIEILDQHISVPMSDLVKETARLLGYQHTGKIIQDRFEAAIRRSAERRQTDIKGDLVVRSGVRTGGS